MHRTLRPALPSWEEVIYAFMLRNAPKLATFFSLPNNGVVEIGRIVEIQASATRPIRDQAL